MLQSVLATFPTVINDFSTTFFVFAKKAVIILLQNSCPGNRRTRTRRLALYCVDRDARSGREDHPRDPVGTKAKTSLPITCRELTIGLVGRPLESSEPRPDAKK